MNEILYFTTYQKRPVEGRGLVVEGEAKFWVFHYQDTGARIDGRRERTLLERRFRKFAGLPVAIAI